MFVYDDRINIIVYRRYYYISEFYLIKQNKTKMSSF